MAHHRKVQVHPVLREIAMLGYGTMIAKYCAAVPTCPAELLKVNVFPLSSKFSLNLHIIFF